MRPVTLGPLSEWDGARHKVTVHCGHLSLRAVVSQPASEMLFVEADVFDKLPLRPGQTVGLWESPAGTDLRLGPLVGIVWEHGHPHRVPKLMRESLKHLVQGAQAAHAVPLLFSMHDVDLDRRSVTGYVATSSGWRKCRAPLPDVVYNRATYADRAERRAARQMRHLLHRRLEIPFINPFAAMDKWDTCEAVQFFRGLRRLIPATMLLQDKAFFLHFLGRHRTVFLKANDGTWGRHVLRVSVPHVFGLRGKVTGYLDGERVRYHARDLHDLWHFLVRCCQDREWVVQRAIDLMKVRNRRFDLRLVLQKDGQGEWQIPHVQVNWAFPNEVVTNRSIATDFLSLEQFREKWTGEQEELTRIVERAQKLALATMPALESVYGQFGEAGLDIGVDPAGIPWLFEANTKPYFFPGEGVRHPFLYARHLATTLWAARHSCTISSNKEGAGVSLADASCIRRQA